jgi:proline iminopeptidase
MKTLCTMAALLLVLQGCSTGQPAQTSNTPATSASSYLDYSGRDDVLSGGVKMIPIETPRGSFRVWTKRVGNNPRVKVLLLHGGPGATHEYLEAFDSYFPSAGYEYYYYDQLGSAYSDQPNEPSLWELPRFVEEVEQVRQALGLTPENFYLYGQSWGGLLAMEYALQHPQNLKGLVISNMMASIPAYNEYAQRTLMPAMDPMVLAEIKQIEAAKQYDSPRYMELLMPSFYTQHLLRMPAEQWPEPVVRSFNHLNKAIYVPLQGPSEMGASGKLEKWDRTADLGRIAVPTLVIGARYDTMDPAHMEMIAKKVQKGRSLLPERQPPGGVRRSEGVLRGSGEIHCGCRQREVLDQLPILLRRANSQLPPRSTRRYRIDIKGCGRATDVGSWEFIERNMASDSSPTRPPAS